MVEFMTRRLLRSLLTIFFVLTIVFFATRLTGDPVQWLLPDDAGAEAVAQMRVYLGVDRPLPEQYLLYIRNAFRGDFGNSFFYRRPVTELFLERLPSSLQLMSFSLLFALAFGIPVGIMAALNRNSLLDRALMSLSFTFYAIPNFVLGIVLILVFSMMLRTLPSGGYGGIRHQLMPMFTWGASYAGLIARLMRSSMLDVIRQDFIRTARSKGLANHRVILKHALRAAFIPVLTMLGLQIAKLIGGSVVVETVFAWPGAGRLIVDAVRTRDFPILQFSVIAVATSVVIVNTLVDFGYGLLDPRLRKGGAKH